MEEIKNTCKNIWYFYSLCGIFHIICAENLSTKNENILEAKNS
jgi:hypothetical protein